MNKSIKLALTASSISGLAIFINKFAVGSITPPLTFTAAKNTLVGLIVISLVLGSGKWRQIKSLSRKDILKLLAIALIGGALPFYLFFTGLSQTSAINAALIQKSLIFWVAIMAIPLFKERLSFVQVATIGLLYSSNLVIGGFSGFAFSTGELYIFLATLFWSVENVIAKVTLKSVDPDIVVSSRMGLGSLILLVVALINNPSSFGQVFSLSPLQTFWMVATAATLLGYTTIWYRALKAAPITTVATVLVSSTIITNLLSAFFVTHTWTVQLTYQALLILAATIIFIQQSSKFKATAQPVV